MTKTTTYLVLISAGHPDNYIPRVGWDAEWSTRAEAEACAERARRNDGWQAKVVEVEAVQS